jgi:hypothetical protein
MDRPNWNYDNSGGEVALAMPSVDTVTDMVVRGEAPTPEIQRAFAQHNGEPVRHDWNHAPVAVKSKGLSRLPDWGDKPRDEAGRYITKSEGEHRAHWEKEGGVAQVMQTVSRKEAAMLSVAPSIEAKIATLDKGFLTKAVDHLRLSPSYGPDGFWRSVKQFEDSLSASERETWAKFCRSLDADEQAALIWAISK